MNEISDEYYPHTSMGDSRCNAIALEIIFNESDLALPFLFSIYLGLGVETIESMMWLTNTMFTNYDVQL
jgi:hypothetical protein